MTTRTVTILETETSPSTGGGTGFPRHLVRCLNPGVVAPPEYEDKALCGAPWDRLNVKHNGLICEKCVEISKTIPRL